MDIGTQIVILGAQCGVLATVVMATVSALRARLPRLDGWPVLVVAAAASVGLVSLFVRPTSADLAVQFAQLSVFTWLLSIGVPALGASIAAKAGSTKTVIVSEAIDPAQPVRVDDKPGA